MSELWYPKIDKDKCIKCGNYVTKCPVKTITYVDLRNEVTDEK